MFVCCVYAGSSNEIEIEIDSTDKSQPFETKTEDITERDGKPRLYLCTVCDKQFKAEKYLNRHKQVHNDENLYSCCECEKGFLTQVALRYHKNIHTGKYLSLIHI